MAYFQNTSFERYIQVYSAHHMRWLISHIISSSEVSL